MIQEAADAPLEKCQLGDRCQGLHEKALVAAASVLLGKTECGDGIASGEFQTFCVFFGYMRTTRSDDQIHVRECADAYAGRLLVSPQKMFWGETGVVHMLHGLVVSIWDLHTVYGIAYGVA